MSKFWNLVTIIWNHHGKCIQNTPDIQLVSCEIPFENVRVLRRQTQVLRGILSIRGIHL